jgi:hypothetical protein
VFTTVLVGEGWVLFAVGHMSAGDECRELIGADCIL